MYSPAYAIETDRNQIDQIIRENPFATIVYTSKNDHSPQSFHLPLILQDDRLIGHMAKANKAWEEIDSTEILIIFHGPDCYVSPVWYGTSGNVPTWNYISVHIRGEVKIHREEIYLKKALSLLGRAMDPEFPIDENTLQHKDLLKGIVGIEISINQIMGKFKLAQSKPEKERISLIQALKNSEDEKSKKIALAIKKTLSSKG